jgi:hypothetical protein
MDFFYELLTLNKLRNSLADRKIGRNVTARSIRLVCHQSGRG